MREVVAIVPSQLAVPGPWTGHVLSYTDIRTAGRLLGSCRSWRELCEDEDGDVWKVLHDTAAREKCVYISPHCTREAMAGDGRLPSWRDMFLNTLQRANMWVAADDGAQLPASLPTNTQHAKADASGESFSVRVTARFRPLDVSRCAGGRAVVLPLHQRLAGIKQMQNFKTTAEAARHLMKERGFGDAADAAPFASCGVLCKDRGNKQAAGHEHAGTGTGGPSLADHFGSPAGDTILDVRREGVVVAVAPSVGIRPFQYDAAFAGTSSQHAVYAAAASPCVAEFINGVDACCIVYGQTGSGKTHTMFGGPAHAMGVVPRACGEIFAALAARRAAVASVVAVSYIQVFGDEVTDLLDSGAPVGQNKSAAQRWVLEGRAQHVVESLDDALALIRVGETQKRRAATKMNERSTRAHCLFMLSLTQQHVATRATASSLLVLADLGGSEDTARSGAADGLVSAGTGAWADYYKRRERMVEAVHINKGLLALKNCIRQLHLRQEGHDVHVPYQDSKLTLLLAAVLGGRARTSIIITASPAASDAADTIHTLRFGEACREIVTSGKADNRERALQKILAALDEEIKDAEEAVRAAEKWVQKKVTRKRQHHDIPAASTEDTGILHTGAASEEEETVTVYRLEGAEDEARRLEQLLEKRRRLLGA